MPSVKFKFVKNVTKKTEVPQVVCKYTSNLFIGLHDLGKF